MFIFQETNNEGEAIGQAVKCKTAVSVSALCPLNIMTSHIEHICAMARVNPDYPYDISDCNEAGMHFSARIIWKDNDA